MQIALGITRVTLKLIKHTVYRSIDAIDESPAKQESESTEGSFLRGSAGRHVHNHRMAQYIGNILHCISRSYAFSERGRDSKAGGEGERNRETKRGNSRAKKRVHRR